jgi:glutamine---fructose-6-phosphate transaminase (isomerizing)
MGSPFPTTGYTRDLLDQPQALRDTIEGLRSQAEVEGMKARFGPGHIDRVVLTGMGSSYHALHPLHQGLVRGGIPAQMVETSELLYSLSGLLKSSTLVICVSQSGRSAEIVSLLEQRSRSVTLLGVTNEHDSPLAQKADASLRTHAGQETTVSCKTYVATLAALAWLEAVLTGGSTLEVLETLDRSVTAVEGYLSAVQDHTADLKNRLAGANSLFLAGRGLSLAAASTGGLIIKEAAHFHAEGMSSAAFRHGPMEMISGSTFVLVFSGVGQAAKFNRSLYEDIRAAGGSAGYIAENAPEAVFRMPPVPTLVYPILEILPVQMMTLALADLRGHEAGSFTHASKVTTKE